MAQRRERISVTEVLTSRGYEPRQTMKRKRRIWIPVLIVAVVVLLAWLWSQHRTFNRWIGTGMEDAIVTKVCRDGTLVAHVNEHFFVVRPGGSRGWPAESAEVCAP